MTDPNSAALPVCDTAAQLDSLPLGSVILDDCGMARQTHSATRGENYWSEAGTDVGYELTSAQLLEQLRRDGVIVHVTVLYRAPDGDA